MDDEALRQSLYNAVTAPYGNVLYTRTRNSRGGMSYRSCTWDVVEAALAWFSGLSFKDRMRLVGAVEPDAPEFVAAVMGELWVEAGTPRDPDVIAKNAEEAK